MNPTLFRILKTLVACDSRNPPRHSKAVVEAMTSVLTSHFSVNVTDHDNGSVNILAVRGDPRILLTAHLDTVPLAAGWTRDPFALTIEGDTAYGLGACDIKGGAAAMVTAALEEDAPVALLFTTDEEAGSSSCIRSFLSTPRSYDLVVVGEPTQCRAVRAHRGIGTATLQFTGQGAHSSVAGASAHSAVHHMLRWGTAALTLDHELDASLQGAGVTGTRFNIGRVSGGEKTNMIADDASARYGLRPPPGIDTQELLRSFARLAPHAQYTENFVGPTLPAAGATAEIVAKTDAHIQAANLTVGDTVDFWTEASLFSAAGLPAFVLGPGDIKQAHAPDESVAIDDLERALAIYRTLLRRSGK